MELLIALGALWVAGSAMLLASPPAVGIVAVLAVLEILGLRRLPRPGPRDARSVSRFPPPTRSDHSAAAPRPSGFRRAPQPPPAPEAAALASGFHFSVCKCSS